MKKVLYVFSQNHEDNLNNNFENAPKEFSYAFNSINDAEYSKNYLIKFTNYNIFLRKIDLLINKFFDFSVDFFSFRNKYAKTIFRKNEILVFTNQNLAISSIFSNYFKKKKNNQKVIVFTMGLFELKNKNILKKILILLILKYTDKFLFLGESEYKFAKIKYSKYKFKFYYTPFSIDTKFWKNQEIGQRKGVLFIGNDHNRDFNTLEKVIIKFPKLQFTVVTNNDFFKNKKYENLNYINTSNNKLDFTDIRNLYCNHKITIIPLLNSLQPSGQSVALQSASCYTPVIISKTIGTFSEEFINNNHVVKFEKNDWVNKLDIIYNDDLTLNEISKNSYELVKNKYNLEIFDRLVLNILD